MVLSTSTSMTTGYYWKETLKRAVILKHYEGTQHSDGRQVPVYSTQIIPFSEWAAGKSPDWWDAFTKVKHDRLAHPEEATLKNVIYSLAGTFIVLSLRNEEVFKAGGVDAEVFDLFVPTYWKFQGQIFKGMTT